MTTIRDLRLTKNLGGVYKNDEDIFWCPGPESNRHALLRGILSPVRLPIPPPGHLGIYITV